MNITNPTCFFNGEYLFYADCRLHISDLQVQRGYGIFDFFREREGRIAWLEDYLDRIFRSLELAEMDEPMDRKELEAVVRRLQDENGKGNGAFKVIITGGFSDTLEGVTGEPNVAVLHVPWTPPPESTKTAGVGLVTDRYQRPNPEIKSLNYFNTLRLVKEMRKHDAVDVIYHTDLITEASRASLFFVKGDHIVTPATGILPGITRMNLLRRFPEIREADIPINEIFEYDELFMSSTSREITPVVAVDGKRLGRGVPGPVTREVMEGFRIA